MTDRICSIEGCDNKSRRRGLCLAHYERDSVKSCQVDGCPDGYVARGYCRKHYWQARESGDLQKLTRPAPEDRFRSKIEKTDGCWNWTGTVLDDGYGMFHDGRRNVLAHRFAYRLANGDIPDGMQIDHICFNRRCVRSEHLRSVTPKQNSEHRPGPNRDSRSGVRGVSWKAGRNRWYAKVRHNGRDVFVGEFRELADAAEAVRRKRNELFTHNDVDRIAWHAAAPLEIVRTPLQPHPIRALQQVLRTTHRH